MSFVIAVPVTDGEAVMLNGLVRVGQIEAETFMGGNFPELVRLTVANEKGNRVAGRIQVDSPAFAQLARQWLARFGSYHPVAKAPGALNFICPDCGCTQLEERVQNAIAYWPIDLTAEGELVDVGSMEIHKMDHDGFGCQNCNFQIPDASTAADAAEWLKQQPYNQKGAN